MSPSDSVQVGGLPVEYSSFVGRRAELAAARTALGTTRLLTLLGPGGVGKTRFAIRLAQSVRRLYPGGTFFVDLSGVTSSGSVVDEVGRILGAPGFSADGYEAIARVLNTERGLLALDNCEQVVEQCAVLVRRLLDDCPQMTVVTTSRAALRLTAETIFVVEPLTTSHPGRGASSPAATLFLERCAAVLPDPTAIELEAIGEICRRLEGLPLAIELAASRVRVLTPTQILDRLSEPLTFLAGGVRDVPDRQQTLRAAITWSYELCTEDEQTLWRNMSVFVGGWDLESAEWMGIESEAPLVLDVVQSLLDKSILIRRQVGDVVYYDMLNTVRRFGLEISPADDVLTARSRHRDLYIKRLAALEADWYGPNQAHWLSLTKRELPNIRAALEFCLESSDGAHAALTLIPAWRVVWQAHNRMDELRRWCAKLIELDSPPTSEICQTMAILGGFEVLDPDPEVGRRRLARAAEIAELLDDDLARAEVSIMTGVDGLDPEKVLAGYEAALAYEGGVNRFPARANIEESIALAHDTVGRTDVAGAMREKLIARAIRAGESFETAELLLQAGSIASGRGELDHATRLLRQSLSLAQNLDNRGSQARAEEVLAHVSALGQDYVRAATLLGIADLGNPIGAIASAFPGGASYRANIETRTRTALGTRAYDAAVARGEALSKNEGIDYALGVQLHASGGSKTRSGYAQVLSARESQVAALVGQGLRDAEIAERLVISKRTAEGHVANSLTKLGFTSRTQLAAWSARESTHSTQ